MTIPLTMTNQCGATSDDYTVSPSSVTFKATETVKSVTFTAIQDDLDDGGESVKLGFETLPDGVTSGSAAETTVTILDSLRVAFGASRYEAYEGGTGATVTVHMNGAVAAELRGCGASEVLLAGMGVTETEPANRPGTPEKR